MSLSRIAIPSPFYSDRGGAKVTTIVLHTAEGSTSIQSLGSWFQNPSAQVSSHVGIDLTPNTVGEYVLRPQKSWTQANANPWCVSAELCAFAAWDSATWSQHSEMLNNCAKWVAEEAAYFGIPIVALTPAQAQSGVPGVCQHVDLGSMGGGHTDCGPQFPMAQVLAMASGQPAPAPGPSPAPPPAGSAPPWPGVYLRNFTSSPAATTWQAQMVSRGWSLDVDGMYGNESEQVCQQFQAEKGLDVDGVVGPDTWAAAWTAPVT